MLALRNEVQIHKKLTHPNIVKYYGYTWESPKAYIVLEYAENGNLYSYLHKRKALSEPEVFKYFCQASLAIQHIHKCDIMHRDIKPENLLLDKDNNLKLCDFGWSTFRINQKR